MKHYVWLGVIAIVCATIALSGGRWLRDNFTVDIPEYPPINKAVWLGQNWTPEQRDWFHHADQGTQTFRIPYEWFIALEQPSLSFTTRPGLLSDTSYLDRYGFIPDNTNSRKAELPVGFAHGGQMRSDDGTIWRNPRTNEPMTRVGLTCAACHTGRLTFQNTTVLIDGAPAFTNLYKFQEAVGLALTYSRFVPFRFGRFADSVLGPGASDNAKSVLRKRLDQVLSKYDEVKALEAKVRAQSLEEGFARLDALNRIGNAVFALDANRPENYVGSSAPVHYPRIWNSSWFEWVQYNGSIQQPMVRNAGEALGVFAWVDLSGAKERLFSSSVQATTLFEIEQLLAGQQPNAERGFNGLKSPKWPSDILPPINGVLAEKGEGLYRDLCQSCHLPPVTSSAFWASNRWLPPNGAGERHLDLELIDVGHIGTDSGQAEGMKNRRVAIPSYLGIETDQFGPALGRVVEMTMQRWYDDQQPPTSEALRQKMNGYRENGIQAPLKYKVRPLSGIWAAPPYLHNGAVPNLYALLSPVIERPKTFYLGSREYDPVNVGYRSEYISGGFEFDTTIRGNGNGGHEFVDSQNKQGVIGRLLSPDERLALIEYLKTL